MSISSFAWSRRRVSSTLMLVTLAMTTFQVTAEDTVLPQGARIMTPGEIHVLYRNRTWQWANGAGYMNDEGRRFTAAVGGDDGGSWAEGRWIITEKGQMCLSATWHSAAGDYPAKTCFSHRIDNGTIYQRRDPDGGWYTFRHAEPKQDDEANKLANADLVSDRMAAIRAELESTSSSELKKGE